MALVPQLSYQGGQQDVAEGGEGSREDPVWEGGGEWYWLVVELLAGGSLGNFGRVGSLGS